MIRSNIREARPARGAPFFVCKKTAREVDGVYPLNEYLALTWERNQSHESQKKAPQNRPLAI